MTLNLNELKKELEGEPVTQVKTYMTEDQYRKLKAAAKASKVRMYRVIGALIDQYLPDARGW